MLEETPGGSRCSAATHERQSPAQPHRGADRGHVSLKPSDRRDPVRLPWSLRGLALMAGLAMLALLLVAARLEPDPQGFGTHQQLGLPACTTVVLWGLRCPSCGMTTAWALALRGRFLEAAAVNAGGLLLALIAIAYIPASCYFFWTGRASRGGWYSWALAICLIAALAVAVLQWLARLTAC